MQINPNFDEKQFEQPPKQNRPKSIFSKRSKTQNVNWMKKWDSKRNSKEVVLINWKVIFAGRNCGYLSFRDNRNKKKKYKILVVFSWKNKEISFVTLSRQKMEKVRKLII